MTAPSVTYTLTKPEDFGTSVISGHPGGPLIVVTLPGSGGAALVLSVRQAWNLANTIAEVGDRIAVGENVRLLTEGPPRGLPDEST